MPRRYKRATRRGRKKGSTRGRILKLSTRQARTKAYDSRIEKVIARVANQEIQKDKAKLIYRQFLFGPFDPLTNIWASSTRIDFAGIVAPMAQIQKLDQATQVKVAPAANPYQTPSTWVDPGTNLIGPMVAMDGFRRANWIHIHGISFEVRASVRALSAVASPLYDSCTLYYRILAVQFEDSDDAAEAPTPFECGPMVPQFGKSVKLDLTQYEQTKDVKRKVLMSGKLTLRTSTLNSDVKFHKRYVSLKRSLKIEYDSLDQNGQRIMRWKPFLCLRSDIPAGVGYQDYQPYVNVVTKLHYTDE